MNVNATTCLKVLCKTPIVNVYITFMINARCRCSYLEGVLDSFLRKCGNKFTIITILESAITIDSIRQVVMSRA